MHPVLPWALSAAILVPSLAAQTIDPVGRVHPAAQPLAQVPVLKVPAIDRAEIQQQDEVRHRSGLPARYAIAFRVHASPATHGVWQPLDATWSLWRLRIEAPEASHVNLGFARFALPASARVMFYSEDYSSILRPFDAADQQPAGDLWTPVVGTAAIVVELYVQTAQRNAVQLDLAQVGSGYRFFGAGPTALGGLDGSGPCQVDVTCPEGAPFQQQIPGVALLSVGGGAACSGFLVNNTALDLRNYFMTANHCGVTPAVASTVVVYWNYQHSTCGGSNAMLNQFTIGAQVRANWATSDFTLLELNSAPNPAWGASYLGWSRSAANAVSAATLHHPSADAKKVTIEYQPVQTTSYVGTVQPGDGSHIRVVDWDVGSNEPGSSGAPLLDQDHRVVGQLHGGFSGCGNNGSDWYGRFYASWTGGGTSSSRLSNWLDPLGSAATTLDTLVPTIASATSYGTGCLSRRAAFAQTFPPNAFDLGGSVASPVTIAFAPTGTGYTVQPGASAWFSPSSPDLGLGDEALATLTLPFAFQHPGGSTSVVRMCSNGFVWLNGTSTGTEPNPSFVSLAVGVSRFAPLWLNLDPGLGGSCHFDVDPSGAAVYLTWSNVPPAVGGAGNSCQLVLRADQSVEYRYRAVPNQPSTCCVGWAPGGTFVPNNLDISAAMPFTTGPDLNPLLWTPSGRPLLGSTQVVTLGNIINPATSIGLTIIGWNEYPGGLPLNGIGAPSCFLYPAADVIEPYLVGGSSYAWSLPIPNSPSLSGVQVFTQGGLLTQNVNPFGLITANACRLVIGNL